MPTSGARRRGWTTWLGLALLVLLALLAGRSALVRSLGETQPQLALTVWPGHELPLFTLGLAGIGAAAREGRSPAAGDLAMIERGGRSAPLAVEPLLVAATARLASAENDKAERLLVAAVRRDPRAPAARFLLADLYIRQNRIGEAMNEIAALDRRLGKVSDQFGPAVAVFVKQPGALPQVAPYLARNAGLRRATLAALAADPAGTPALLQLARPGDEREAWLSLAVERLLRAGDLATALALYQGAGGRANGRTLTSWRAGDPPQPLGWHFGGGSGGAAEPVSGGPLRLAYFGREEAVLAEHQLLLRPGRYRLAQQLGGSVPPGTFEWRLTCSSGGAVLATRPLLTGQGQGELQVPATCPAQKLQLWGRPGDFPRTVNAELSAIILEPAGGTR